MVGVTEQYSARPHDERQPNSDCKLMKPKIKLVLEWVLFASFIFSSKAGIPSTVTVHVSG